MRKNQSKFKNSDYVNQLIEKATSYDGISYIKSENGYVYFNCSMHGQFRKRLDHLQEITHHSCPKCSKQVYSKLAGQTIASKCNVSEYVDITKYKLLEECTGACSKMKFLCVEHNEVFEATPQRCFGCDICKKEHHYKWAKDWRHIEQEEIIRRCKEIHPEYDYSLVKYVNATTPIDIVCPKHGVFRMSYANLTNKSKPQNCPFCSKMHTHKISKMTKEVLARLTALDIDYTTEKTFKGLKDKKVLPIDIYLPKYNAVIECQGVQHFRFVKSFCKDRKGFEYIKKHDKIKFDYFSQSDIKLYYYTSKYNEDLIPNDYFGKVYTDIDELISNITK